MQWFAVLKRPVETTASQKVAHIRQSRPDSGLGFKVKLLKTFKLFHRRSEAFACERFERGCSIVA
jgi:hypothetical protein